jgi:hypothetical protein
MIEALAPAIGCAVCTELPADGPKSLDMERVSAHRRWTPAAVLAEACEAAGVPAEAEPDFDAALRRARELAAGPPPAALVVTGSHYVLAPARALPPRSRVLLQSSLLCDHSLMDKGAGSELLSMMALVAAVVAAVILIFFGIGYLFGSLFL